MTTDTEQLVRETMELTHAAPPPVLADDGPVLRDVSPGKNAGTYLVGLIGGKEVGKSALVNALVGAKITEQTSHGPGTHTVIAYAHRARQRELAALLEDEVPGRYTIVTHEIDRLAHQVLLDLPDIDSRFSDHIEITRRMLRHTLFPIWVQSVEKYADVQPQNLLAKVAAGNDPANFLFCLNKVDQLEKSAGEKRVAPPFSAFSGNPGSGGHERAALFGGARDSSGEAAQRGDAPLAPGAAGERKFPRGAAGKNPDDPAIIQTASSAAIELRDDFAARLARVLLLAAPPRVFMISAIHPVDFDLPELSRLLSREKSGDIVAQSRQLAERRRQRSLLAWLGQQDIPGRAARLAQLDQDASEMVSQRLGVPLVENAISSIVQDAGYRMVMGDGVFDRRVSRWPIINILHVLISPLRFVVRSNAAASPFLGTESLVAGHLPTGHGSVASLVQTTFAQLHQSEPGIAPLYAGRKLWEAMDAQAAEGRLRGELIDTVNRQREIVNGRLAGRAGIIAPIFRMLLTVGALLWFPFVQPALAAWLHNQSALGKVKDFTVLAVEVFSAENLLKNAAFLLLWYLVIWATLRWSTGRKVERLLARWKTADQADPALNLTTRALAWMDDLLSPIRAAREQVERLAGKIKQIESEFEREAKSAA